MGVVNIFPVPVNDGDEWKDKLGFSCDHKHCNVKVVHDYHIGCSWTWPEGWLSVEHTNNRMKALWFCPTHAKSIMRMIKIGMDDRYGNYGR